MAHKRRRHSNRKRNNYFRDTIDVAGCLISLGVISSLSTSLFKK